MGYSNPLAMVIFQGKRFKKVFRWAQTIKVYKAIAAIPQTGPLRLQVNNHGLPDGWRFTPRGIKGPTQLNDRVLTATLIDPNTIEVNEVHGGDLAPYVSDGYIEYFAPVDLTGMAGRAYFKKSVADAAASLEVSTANGRMILDNVAKKITFDVPDTVTAAIVDEGGVWDWEMVSGSDVSSPIPELELPPWRLLKEAAK